MMEMEMNAELERENGSDEGEACSEGSSAGSVFYSLEHDYEKILREMKSNEALAPFEAEYSRLFEMLYTSRRNEDILNEQCKIMKDQLSEQSRRLDEFELAMEENEEKVANLNEEIMNAKNFADAAHSRELQAQDVIENLRVTVTKLKRDIDQKNKQLSLDEDNVANKQKEEILKERDRLVGEIEVLRQRMKTMASYNEELERKTSAIDHQIIGLSETLDAQAGETSKERRAREKLEIEHQAAKDELKLKNLELQHASATVKTTLGNASKLESIIKDLKTEVEKGQKELNLMLNKKMAMQTEIENLHGHLADAVKEMAKKKIVIKDLNIKIQKGEIIKDKLKSEKELALKRYVTVENNRKKCEDELKNTAIDLKNAQIEITDLKRQADREKQAMDSLNREKSLMTQQMTSMKEEIANLTATINISDLTRKKLESALSDLAERSTELRRQNQLLEKEKEILTTNGKALAQQMEDCSDEMKLKNNEIADLKKRIYEAGMQARQQQNMFDALRMERNAMAKNLLECKDEIDEMKHKLKILRQQNEQLKEDMATKDIALRKEEFLRMKARKESDALKVELQVAYKNISSLRHTIDDMKKEEKKLRNAIREGDMTISHQKKDIDAALNERDIIGTQLVRRNDELSLQYRRIQILNETLQKGEQQYAQRLDDLRLLKGEVKRKETEKAILEKHIQNTCDLRVEVFHLERDLMKERVKVMALEEEVQTPMNFHRWRKLERTDPPSYELVMKIHLLQKRILKMTTKMLEKEKKLADMEKIYMNLREIISKQPGPDVYMYLKKTQKALRIRKDKMKCVVAELNMSETRTIEYKFDLEQMKGKFRDLKTKYLLEKKAGEPPVKMAKTPALPPVIVCNTRYCGGGFNMTLPAQNQHNMPVPTPSH